MEKNLKKELEKFKLVMEIPVRWAEMDAFQHVNNTIYLKWTECARVEYISKYIIGSFSDLSLGPILARQDCRYLHPITYPDTVSVGFRVSEIQDDRLICETKIFSQKHKKLSAIVYTTIMAYDFINHRKAEIPIDWVMKIQDIEE